MQRDLFSLFFNRLRGQILYLVICYTQRDWLIAFYIHTPPIEDIPNFSNPSLEFPGYLLHDTLEITLKTQPIPWNFQVISYIVPWKYGITQPLPGISRLSLTLYPGNMA
jgi:hypothetical protein